VQGIELQRQVLIARRNAGVANVYVVDVLIMDGAAPNQLPNSWEDNRRYVGTGPAVRPER
jgi:hypothetical protein